MVNPQHPWPPMCGGDSQPPSSPLSPLLAAQQDAAPRRQGHGAAGAVGVQAVALLGGHAGSALLQQPLPGQGDVEGGTWGVPSASPRSIPIKSPQCPRSHPFAPRARCGHQALPKPSLTPQSPPGWPPPHKTHPATPSCPCLGAEAAGQAAGQGRAELWALQGGAEPGTGGGAGLELEGGLTAGVCGERRRFGHPRRHQDGQGQGRRQGREGLGRVTAPGSASTGGSPAAPSSPEHPEVSQSRSSPSSPTQVPGPCRCRCRCCSGELQEQGLQGLQGLQEHSSGAERGRG